MVNNRERRKFGNCQYPSFCIGKILQTTKYCVILGTFRKNRTYYRLEHKNRANRLKEDRYIGKERRKWQRSRSMVPGILRF